MQDEALADLEEVAIEARDDQYTLCLFRPEWHQGVVGIVAARLKDRFHRPAIVFARGRRRRAARLGPVDRRVSPARRARSSSTKRSPGTIVKFGGHAFAAGLTLREDALPAFRDAFEAAAREQLTPAAARADLRKRRHASRAAS